MKKPYQATANDPRDRVYVAFLTPYPIPKQCNHYPPLLAGPHLRMKSLTHKPKNPPQKSTTHSQHPIIRPINNIPFINSMYEDGLIEGRLGCLQCGVDGEAGPDAMALARWL